MRFSTVLFDLDGTLIDTGPIILASFRHATRTVLGRVIPDDVLLAGVGGSGLVAQMEAIDAERAAELVDVYTAHNVPLHADVPAFPGIPEVLARLDDEGRRLGIVTAKRRSTVEVALESIPIGRHFDELVAFEDTTRHKPAPEPLQLALERLGSEPSTAAYVGDSPFDVLAARAAGLFAIAATWGAVHALDVVAEAGPDVVLHDPLELLDVL